MQPVLLSVRGRIGWLGQMKIPVTLRLLVKDFKDRGFTDIGWEIIRKGAGELPIMGKTNGNGTSVATFDTSEPTFAVHVYLPEGLVKREMKVSDAEHDVLAFRSVENAPQPILNTLEIATGASGILLYILGISTGFTPLERVGEVLFVATVFTRVGRAAL